MPEFPEVESLRRHLVKRGLVGRTITAAKVSRPKTILTPTPEAFERGVAGARIQAFQRRGKYLILRLDAGSPLDVPVMGPGRALVVHLRMTGKLELAQPDEPPDEVPRVIFFLDSGQELRFTDWRALGKVWLVQDPEEVVGKLGPEPLGEGFTPEYVRNALGRPTAIKALLLDQRWFAGVGNIYADEALWCARVHPTSPARELSGEESSRLHGCIKEILEAATQLLERYLDEGGKFEAENGRGGIDPGPNPRSRFMVPRRKGQPCRRCGTAIQGIRVGGRGTFFCPQCQT